MTNNSDIPEGYKATELGMLPEEWDIVTLGEIADYINGYGFEPSEWTTTGLPIIRIQNLTKSSDIVNYYDSNLDQKYKVISGDLLISWSASLGTFFWNGPDAWLNQHIFKVTNYSKNLDKNYFYYRITQDIEALKSKSRGSTMKHITKKEFLAIKIPLPPLPEQHAIATTIRTVQEAKEKNDTVIMAIKALKASMMRHLFTYGPVPPEDAERVALKETEIGQVPEEWDAVKLGDVSEFLQYGTSKKCDYDVKGYPVLRIPNIVNGIIDSTDLKFLDTSIEDFDKIQLKIGDILFVRTNGVRNLVGRCAIYQGEPENSLFASYLIRVRLKSDRALPAFVQYYAETPSGREFLSGQASGSADGKFNINTQTIKSVVLPLPDIMIQKRIVDIIASIDQKLAAEHSRKVALDTIFTSLLHDLMIVKIRVTNH